MAPHEFLMKRRQELGLRDTDVAAGAGLSIFEYGDLESYADEIYTVVPVLNIRKLCTTPKIDIRELCESIYAANGVVAQSSDLIVERDKSESNPVSRQREELGLSIGELSEMIGFEPEAVERIESDILRLEDWSLELIEELAKALQLPWPAILRL